MHFRTALCRNNLPSRTPSVHQCMLMVFTTGSIGSNSVPATDPRMKRDGKSRSNQHPKILISGKGPVQWSIFFITIDFRTHCILFPYLGHIQIKYRMQKTSVHRTRPQVSTQQGGQVGVAVEISSAALFSCHNGREFCTGCKVLAFRAKRFRSRED